MWHFNNSITPHHRIISRSQSSHNFSKFYQVAKGTCAFESYTEIYTWKMETKNDVFSIMIQVIFGNRVNLAFYSTWNSLWTKVLQNIIKFCNTRVTDEQNAYLYQVSIYCVFYKLKYGYTYILAKMSKKWHFVLLGHHMYNVKISLSAAQQKAGPQNLLQIRDVEEWPKSNTTGIPLGLVGVDVFCNTTKTANMTHDKYYFINMPEKWAKIDCNKGLCWMLKTRNKCLVLSW